MEIHIEYPQNSVSGFAVSGLAALGLPISGIEISQLVDFWSCFYFLQPLIFSINITTKQELSTMYLVVQ